MLLGADGLGDLALLGLDVLLEPHALLRHRRFSTTGSSERSVTWCSSSEMSGPSSAVVAVGVGDRLALDADLLAANRDGLGHLVLDDVLLQPDAAGFALGRADAQFLLGASHRVVGVWAAGIAAGPASLAAGRVGGVAALPSRMPEPWSESPYSRP